MQQRNTAVVLQREPGSRHAEPNLLVTWESWWPNFLRNLADYLSPKPAFSVSKAASGRFWPDVFVERPVPWKNLGQSSILHIAAIMVIVAGTDLWRRQEHVRLHQERGTTALTFYNVSEYLPVIKASTVPKVKRAHPQKGVPALAKQEIISVPAEPDNSLQTILNPPHPNILPRNVVIDLPNLVMSATVPAPPVAALSSPKINLPDLHITPVQPAPEARRASQLHVKLPEVSVVEPAPSTKELKQTLDDAKLAQLTPAVAAPKIPEPVDTSRTTALPSAEMPAPQPVAPTPSTQRSGGLPNASSQVVALSLHPKAPEGEIRIPDASRSGIFAASPTGKPDAPGIPEILPEAGKPTAAAGGGSDQGVTMQNLGSVSIGGNKAAQQTAATAAVASAPAKSRSEVAPRAVAAAVKPSLPDIGRRSVPLPSANSDAKVEDRVFAGKKYYSMQLNMPNLTSAAGSWIIRFAELKESTQPGELSRPVATDKVDPAYPPDLIRDQVEGTVVLYAVIHSDGSVGDVRVLEGFHYRLDENAKIALLRWHFQPAMKNGVPVELEAVVQIPFKARRTRF